MLPPLLNRPYDGAARINRRECSFVDTISNVDELLWREEMLRHNLKLSHAPTTVPLVSIAANARVNTISRMLMSLLWRKNWMLP